MNKNCLLVAGVLALSLSWAGCGKSGSGPVELKLKWREGEQIVQNMEMKQASEMQLPTSGEPMKQQMDMGQDYSLTVLKAEPDGGHDIELEFLGMRAKMSMGGKVMAEYDSTNKAAGGADNPMGQTLGKLVGAKIEYVLDASNNVIRLQGVDDLLARISSGADAAAAAPLKSMFNDDYFKQMMSQSKYLPPKPVQPGDSWPVQIDMPLGPVGTLIMDFTYTFQSWETHDQRNCARLDFKGTLKAKPSDKSASQPVSIANLNGALSGTSWFDPDLGMIVDSKMKQDMNMVMSMNMGTAQTMTNHMIQDMTIRVASVK